MTTQNTIWTIENDSLIRYLGDDPHVLIPKEIKRIRGNTFYSTAAKHIEFSNPDIILEEEAFRGSKISEIILPKQTQRIENRTFAGCTSLKNIILPNNIVYIGKQAFEGCAKLNSILLPDSLKMIDENAFKNCGLISLELPDNVCLIGKQAFYQCPNLKKVLFSNNLRILGDASFADCHRLSFVIFKNGILSIGNNVFQNDVQLKEIVLPDTLLDLGEDAFYGIKHIQVNAPTALKEHIKHYERDTLDPACNSTVFLPKYSQIFDSTADIIYR